MPLTTDTDIHNHSSLPTLPGSLLFDTTTVQKINSNIIPHHYAEHSRSLTQRPPTSLPLPPPPPHLPRFCFHHLLSLMHVVLWLKCASRAQSVIQSDPANAFRWEIAVTVLPGGKGREQIHIHFSLSLPLFL